MSTVVESKVVTAIRGFKAELRANEGAQVHLMAERYLDVERALESNIAALSEQIARLAAQGIEPSWSQLYRMERWQTLQLQTMEELARFNGWAADVIKAEQLDMITRGIDNASAALETMKPGLGQFTRMPHDALRGMVGIARDGSPLGDLLATSYPTMRDAITRELTRSVALGRNPRVTAAAIRKETGLGLNRALTIARTEQLRVYREATRESYKDAGVTQYQRIAALDERTCIGCAIADGEIIAIESEFDEHTCGRCDLLPLIPGVENPVAEGYKEWFDKQPAETQASILGPGRYDALKSGSASWSDLATHVSDPKWGGAWVPSNVSSLAGVKGADVVRAAERVAEKAAGEWKDLSSIGDAEKFAQQFVKAGNQVTFKGMSLDNANAVCRALRDDNAWRPLTLGQISGGIRHKGALAEYVYGRRQLHCSPKWFKEWTPAHSTIERKVSELTVQRDRAAALISKYGGVDKYGQQKIVDECDRAIAALLRDKALGRTHDAFGVSDYFETKADGIRSFIHHELGHMREDQWISDMPDATRRSIMQRMLDLTRGKRDDFRYYPSEYSHRGKEWFPEVYALHMMGRDDLLHPDVVGFIKWVMKEMAP